MLKYTGCQIHQILLLGKLTIEVLPVEYKVRGGKPNIHRYELTAADPIKCRDGGGPCHRQQTCPKPSTEVRNLKNREKGIEMA
jgi:hypothetical protein